jgi:hypothetical protein
MFNSFARFDAFRQHGPAAGFPLSNDNPLRAPACRRARAGEASPAVGGQTETSRLECHWSFHPSALPGAQTRHAGGHRGTPAWMLRVA